jgi:hypothetical protein
MPKNPNLGFTLSCQSSAIALYHKLKHWKVKVSKLHIIVLWQQNTKCKMSSTTQKKWKQGIYIYIYIYIYHVCKFGCVDVLQWWWFGDNYHSNPSVDNQKLCWKQLGMFHDGDHQHSNYMALNLMYIKVVLEVRPYHKVRRDLKRFNIFEWTTQRFKNIHS